jgi:hypothetical protein
MSDYIFRGTYDSGETTRIQGVLDQQREMFNEEDQKQQTLEKNIKKYGIILLGAAAIILITYKIKNR